MEKEQKEEKMERLILNSERTNPHRKKDRKEKEEERKKDNVIPGVGRKKRREASVSAIPGFLESNIGRRKEEEKGSVGICDSWFYRESLHTERSLYGGTHGRIWFGNHRKWRAASEQRKE